MSEQLKQRKLVAEVEVIHAERDWIKTRTRTLQAFTAMAWLITVVGLICLVAVSW